MLDALLLMSALAAAPPSPIVFAEPLGPDTLRLGQVLAGTNARECDRQGVGVDPASLGKRPLFRIHEELFVNVGSRAIGRARVTDVQVFEDASARCHVVATAVLDTRVPLLGRNDVLWASRTRWPSVTRKAPQRGAAAKAIALTTRQLPPSCAGRQEAIARGSALGAWVSVGCDGAGAALVRVPKKGEAEVVLLEPPGTGRLTLIDVLDPNRKKENLLVLARESDGSRVLELWSVRGPKAERLASGLPAPHPVDPRGAM